MEVATEHTSALRSAARNSLVGGLGAITASVAGFVLAVIAGRALGTAGAGVFYACIALAMVGITVCCAGADTGLLWAMSRDRAENAGRNLRRILRTALGPVALLSLAAAAALWVVAPFLAPVISSPSLADTAESALRVMSVGLLAGPLVLCLVQGSRALGSVLPFALIQQIGVPTLRVLLVLVLVGTALPADETYFVLAWVVPLVLLAPVAAAVVVRRTATARGRADREPVVAWFWRYSLWRGLGNAGAMALTWLDVVIVAALASPAEAGAYAAASRFATSGQLGLQAMRLGIGPGVAAAFARGDLGRVNVLHGLSAQWATLLSWPIFLILACFPAAALGLFGPGFAEPSGALVVLSVAMMASVACGNVNTLLLMSGNSRWAATNTWIALSVTIAVDLALVPTLGGLGAAIGWTAGVLIENGLGLLLIRRRLSVRLGGRALLGAMLAVCAIVGASVLVAWVSLGRGVDGLLLSGLLTALGMAAYLYLARARLQVRMLFGRGDRAGR